jgi:hypothetical protein
METADEILKEIKPLLLEAKADARRATILSRLKEDPPPPNLNECQTACRKRVVRGLISKVVEQR